MPRLSTFNVARDGYHFANQFTNRILPGTPITFETGGLCGGMCMCVLDHWRSGVPIPTHRRSDFPPSAVDNGSPVPGEGTRLRDYIYQRQLDSLLTKAMFTRWITAPWVTPQSFHDWAVGSEFDLVRAEIGRGRPALIGLWLMPGRGTLSGHQVLAYGWDENPRRLYCYDPNKPDEEAVLTPISPQQGIEITAPTAGTSTYRGYFLTDVYNWGESPPRQPSYIDLAVTSGVNVNSTGQLGGAVSSSGEVTNIGEYTARFKFLFTWSRGPGGVNTDSRFGGAEPNLTKLEPGESHTVNRSAASYGDTPGTHQVGLSYGSEQDAWRQLPARWPANAARTFDLFRAKTLAEDRWFAVPEGARSPVRTNITLRPGDDIALIGQGNIWAGVWFTGTNGPAGWEDRIETNPASPMHHSPDARPFCLIGRFGTGPWFRIGNGLPRRAFTGSSPQPLELWINDNTPGNGSGEFRCRVQVWR